MVWRGEIEFNRVNLLQRDVFMEFRAVVESNRLDALAVLDQRIQGRLGCLQHALSFVTIAKPLLRSTKVSTQWRLSLSITVAHCQ
jgi:hypothetical protein